jgi:hypothetical protein
MLDRPRNEFVADVALPYEPRLPLVRNADWTQLELTLLWVSELIACNPDVRRAAVETEDFMKALQSAYLPESPHNSDSTMETIVEAFQQVLSRAFAAKRKRLFDV